MQVKKMCALALATLAISSSAPAQLPPPGPEPASATMRFYYARVKGILITAAERMPAEHYAFRPTADVRSFGAMVAHAANANFMLCASAKGEPSPVGQAELEKTKTTKAEIVAALKSAFDYCDPVFASLKDAQLGDKVTLFRTETMKSVALSQSIAHMWEHYGNMVTYLRMKGLVPPTSDPPPQAQQPAAPAQPQQTATPQPAAAQISSARVEAMPPGWKMRLDSDAAHAAEHSATEAPKFWTMPPGWHVTSGPAAIYYDPSYIARGEFRLESQTFLFPPGERREGYGFLFGGKDLDGENPTYTYFLLRRDGRYLIKQRTGATTKDLVAWTEHPAIVKHPGGNSDAKNEMAIETNGPNVDFIVNGQKVHSLPRSQAPTDGLVGLRVNHNVNIHITYLTIKPRGAAMRTIEREVTVAGPLAEVWKAWTTREGITSFFAPDAKVELAPGGAYEVYFDTTLAAGRKGGEGCQVIAFEPMKRFSFTWNAPPTLPNVRRQRSRVTLEFAAAGPQSTRVKLVHDDWGTGAEWDQAYAYFQQAWPAVLGNLQYRFATGPVQWKDGKFTVAGQP